MPRRLRYIPKPGTLVEVTCRIIHGRMLLKPNRPLNEMIVGTLARAKRRYGVRICAAAFLSNHAHLLVQVDDAKQLASFMAFVSSKIAREVGRRLRWREKVWGRRYSAIVVSDETEAQVARLRYVLAQGVKEHLVARCTDWPGVHAAEALATGRPLAGYWSDRTAEYRARLQRKKVGSRRFTKRETLTFDPLPCWSHLAPDVYQTCVADMVAGIEAEAEADRKARGIAPRGVKATLRQSARRQHNRANRPPAPAFHAATNRVRLALMEAYRWFVVAYRNAAERWRQGDHKAPFPEGCFPPAPPFIADSSRSRV